MEDLTWNLPQHGISRGKPFRVNFHKALQHQDSSGRLKFQKARGQIVKTSHTTGRAPPLIQVRRNWSGSVFSHGYSKNFLNFGKGFFLVLGMYVWLIPVEFFVREKAFTVNYPSKLRFHQNSPANGPVKTDVWRCFSLHVFNEKIFNENPPFCWG